MRQIVALLLCLAVTHPARAQEAPYITPATMGLIRLLAPPPDEGSAEDRADLRAVLAAQAAAGPGRRAQATADTHETVYDMFGVTLGPGFDRAALPATTRLFGRLGITEASVTDPVKPLFHRVRPWIAHPEVEAIAPPTRTFSYPSGHATRVTMAAIVLSSMVPEQQRAIWQRADDYAQSRVVGGMHYPSDVQASGRAGTAIIAAIQSQQEFYADVAAATNELRPALGLGPLMP